MSGMNEGMRPSLFDQLGGGDGQDDLDWFEEMKASGTRDGGTEERSRRRRARSRTDGHGIAMAETVYGQINVYGVTTKSERCERSYRTRSAAGNGIGGREAPVPYGS